MDVIHKLAVKFGLVPISAVEDLAERYERLLGLTAKTSWAAGADSSCNAVYDALKAEGQRAAAAAPRGVLHHHPKIDGVNRDALVAEAKDLDRALHEAGVRRYEVSTDSTVHSIDGSEPLIQSVRAPADLYAGMVGAARASVAEQTAKVA